MSARRFYPFAFIAFLPVLSPGVLAQTPASPSLNWILARHFEARGGLSKIKAIQGLTSMGRVLIGGMDLSLHLDNPRGAFRSETSFNGLTKVESFDGQQGWISDPFTGAPDPTPMNDAQLRQARLQADFDGPLVDWEAKGHQVSFEGMAQVEGEPTYVLKVRLAGGGVLTSFISARTFMEVKAVNEAVSAGNPVEVETRLSDYRAVDGVMLPFRLTITPRGQAEGLTIQFESVVAKPTAPPTRPTR